MNEGVDVNRGQYEVEPEILNKVLEMNEEANSKKEEQSCAEKPSKQEWLQLPQQNLVTMVKFFNIHILKRHRTWPWFSMN